MKLEEFISSIVSLTTTEMQDVLQHFSRQEFPKGKQIIQQGQKCKHLFYIESGLGRSFYFNEKGKDVTLWFFSENNVMLSVESFFQQMPSYYEMEMLEDSIVYGISYDKLQELFDKYHSMERFGRLLSIQLLTDLADKLNAIQFQTAKERYHFLIEENRNIAYRAPLGHIASYLGITQETLSRIRADY